MPTGSGLVNQDNNTFDYFDLHLNKDITKSLDMEALSNEDIRNASKGATAVIPTFEEANSKYGIDANQYNYLREQADAYNKNIYTLKDLNRSVYLDNPLLRKKGFRGAPNANEVNAPVLKQRRSLDGIGDVKDVLSKDEQASYSNQYIDQTGNMQPLTPDSEENLDKQGKLLVQTFDEYGDLIWKEARKDDDHSAETVKIKGLNRALETDSSFDSFGRGFSAGFVGSAVKGAGTITEIVGNWIDMATTGKVDTEDWSSKFGARARNWTNTNSYMYQNEDEQKGALDNWNGFMFSFANGLATSVQAIVAGGIALPAGAVASQVASYGIGSVVSTGAFYEEAKAAGINDNAAGIMAVIAGAITFGVEKKIGVNRITEFWTGAEGRVFAKKVAQDVFQNTPKEVLERIGKGVATDVEKKSFMNQFKTKALSSFDKAISNKFLGNPIEEGAEEFVEGRLDNLVKASYNSAQKASETVMNDVKEDTEKKELESLSQEKAKYQVVEKQKYVDNAFMGPDGKKSIPGIYDENGVLKPATREVFNKYAAKGNPKEYYHIGADGKQTKLTEQEYQQGLSDIEKRQNDIRSKKVGPNNGMFANKNNEVMGFGDVMEGAGEETFMGFTSSLPLGLLGLKSGKATVLHAVADGKSEELKQNFYNMNQKNEFGPNINSNTGKSFTQQEQNENDAAVKQAVADGKTGVDLVKVKPHLSVNDIKYLEVSKEVENAEDAMKSIGPDELRKLDKKFEGNEKVRNEYLGSVADTFSAQNEIASLNEQKKADGADVAAIDAKIKEQNEKLDAAKKIVEKHSNPNYSVDNNLIKSKTTNDTGYSEPFVNNVLTQLNKFNSNKTNAPFATSEDIQSHNDIIAAWHEQRVEDKNIQIETTKQLEADRNESFNKVLGSDSVGDLRDFVASNKQLSKAEFSQLSKKADTFKGKIVARINEMENAFKEANPDIPVEVLETDETFGQEYASTKETLDSLGNLYGAESYDAPVNEYEDMSPETIENDYYNRKFREVQSYKNELETESTSLSEGSTIAALESSKAELEEDLKLFQAKKSYDDIKQNVVDEKAAKLLGDAGKDFSVSKSRQIKDHVVHNGSTRSAIEEELKTQIGDLDNLILAAKQKSASVEQRDIDYRIGNLGAELNITSLIIDNSGIATKEVNEQVSKARELNAKIAQPELAYDERIKLLDELESIVSFLKSTIYKNKKTALSSESIEKLINRYKELSKNVGGSSYFTAAELKEKQIEEYVFAKNNPFITEVIPDNETRQYVGMYLINFLNTLNNLDDVMYAKMYNDYVKSQDSFLPSYEQQASGIKPLLAHLVNPKSTTKLTDIFDRSYFGSEKGAILAVDGVSNSFIKNSIGVRGYAGAGKTQMVFATAFNLYSILKSDQAPSSDLVLVVPFSNLKNTANDQAEKILSFNLPAAGDAKEVKSTFTSQSVKLAVDFINNPELTPSSVLVIDEASLLSGKDLNAIKDSVEKTGNTVVFLYDDSQPTSEDYVRPPVETVTTRTPGLFQVYRTGVADIANVQKSFRKVMSFSGLKEKTIKALSFLPMNYFFNGQDRKGAVASHSQNDVIGMFLSDERAGTEKASSKALILATDEQADLFKQKYPEHAGSIYSVSGKKYGIQGKDVENAYVLIEPTPNMDTDQFRLYMANMLTATSRAMKFISFYVPSDVAIKTVSVLSEEKIIDANINDAEAKTKRLEQQKKSADVISSKAQSLSPVAEKLKGELAIVQQPKQKPSVERPVEIEKNWTNDFGEQKEKLEELNTILSSGKGIQVEGTILVESPNQSFVLSGTFYKAKKNSKSISFVSSDPDNNGKAITITKGVKILTYVGRKVKPDGAKASNVVKKENGVEIKVGSTVTAGNVTSVVDEILTDNNSNVVFLNNGMVVSDLSSIELSNEGSGTLNLNLDTQTSEKVYSSSSNEYANNVLPVSTATVITDSTVLSKEKIQQARALKFKLISKLSTYKVMLMSRSNINYLDDTKNNVTIGKIASEKVFVLADPIDQSKLSDSEKELFKHISIDGRLLLSAPFEPESNFGVKLHNPESASEASINFSKAGVSGSVMNRLNKYHAFLLRLFNAKNVNVTKTASLRKPNSGSVIYGNTSIAFSKFLDNVSTNFGTEPDDIAIKYVKGANNKVIKVATITFGGGKFKYEVEVNNQPVNDINELKAKVKGWHAELNSLINDKTKTVKDEYSDIRNSSLFRFFANNSSATELFKAPINEIVGRAETLKSLKNLINDLTAEVLSNEFTSADKLYYSADFTSTGDMSGTGSFFNIHDFETKATALSMPQMFVDDANGLIPANNAPATPSSSRLDDGFEKAKIEMFEALDLISIDQFKEQIRQFISGDFIDSKNLKFKEGLELNGKPLWGLVQNGQITIDTTNGLVHKFVGRHEVIHLINRYILSDDTQAELYKAVRAIIGDSAPIVEVEEYLASLFENPNWRNSSFDVPSNKKAGLKGILKDFFNWVSKLIYRIQNGETASKTIKNYFSEVESGYYKSSAVRTDDNGTFAMAKAAKNFTGILDLSKRLGSEMAAQRLIEYFNYVVYRNSMYNNNITVNAISNNLTDVLKSIQATFKEFNAEDGNYEVELNRFDANGEKVKVFIKDLEPGDFDFISNIQDEKRYFSYKLGIVEKGMMKDLPVEYEMEDGTKVEKPLGEMSKEEIDEFLPEYKTEWHDAQEEKTPNFNVLVRHVFPNINPNTFEQLTNEGSRYFGAGSENSEIDGLSVGSNINKFIFSNLKGAVKLSQEKLWRTIYDTVHSAKKSAMASDYVEMDGQFFPTNYNARIKRILDAKEDKYSKKMNKVSGNSILNREYEHFKAFYNTYYKTAYSTDSPSYYDYVYNYQMIVDSLMARNLWNAEMAAKLEVKRIGATQALVHMKPDFSLVSKNIQTHSMKRVKIDGEQKIVINTRQYKKGDSSQLIDNIKNDIKGRFFELNNGILHIKKSILQDVENNITVNDSFGDIKAEIEDKADIRKYRKVNSDKITKRFTISREENSTSMTFSYKSFINGKQELTPLVSYTKKDGYKIIGDLKSGHTIAEIMDFFAYSGAKINKPTILAILGSEYSDVNSVYSPDLIARYIAGVMMTVHQNVMDELTGSTTMKYEGNDYNVNHFFSPNDRTFDFKKQIADLSKMTTSDSETKSGDIVIGSTKPYDLFTVIQPIAKLQAELQGDNALNYSKNASDKWIYNVQQASWLDNLFVSLNPGDSLNKYLKDRIRNLYEFGKKFKGSNLMKSFIESNMFLNPNFRDAEIKDVIYFNGLTVQNGKGKDYSKLYYKNVIDSHVADFLNNLEKALGNVKNQTYILPSDTIPGRPENMKFNLDFGTGRRIFSRIGENSDHQMTFEVDNGSIWNNLVKPRFEFLRSAAIDGMNDILPLFGVEEKVNVSNHVQMYSLLKAKIEDYNSSAARAWTNENDIEKQNIVNNILHLQANTLDVVHFTFDTDKTSGAPVIRLGNKVNGYMIGATSSVFNHMNAVKYDVFSNGTQQVDSLFENIYRKNAKLLSEARHEKPVKIDYDINGDRYYATTEDKKKITAVHPFYKGFWLASYFANIHLGEIIAGMDYQYSSNENRAKRTVPVTSPGANANNDTPNSIGATMNIVMLNEKDSMWGVPVQGGNVFEHDAFARGQKVKTVSKLDGQAYINPIHYLRLEQTGGIEDRMSGSRRIKRNIVFKNESSQTNTVTKSLNLSPSAQLLQFMPKFEQTILPGMFNSPELFERYLGNKLARMSFDDNISELNDWLSLPENEGIFQKMNALVGGDGLSKSASSSQYVDLTDTNTAIDGFANAKPTTVSTEDFGASITMANNFEDSEASAMSQVISFLGIGNPAIADVVLRKLANYTDVSMDAFMSGVEKSLKNITKLEPELNQGDAFKKAVVDVVKRLSKKKTSSYIGAINELLSNSKISLSLPAISNVVMSSVIGVMQKFIQPKFKSSFRGMQVSDFMVEIKDEVTNELRPLNEMKYFYESEEGLKEISSAEDYKMVMTQNKKVITVPGEMIAPFTQAKKFALGADVRNWQPVDFTSLHLPSGELISLKNLTVEEIQVLLDAHVVDGAISDVRFANKSAAFIKNYIDAFEQATEVYAVRIPSHDVSSGGVYKIVRFVNDSGNIAITSSKKSIFDGSDYDGDELSIFSKTVSKSFGFMHKKDKETNLTNEILDALKQYYLEPTASSYDMMNTPTSMDTLKALKNAALKSADSGKGVNTKEMHDFASNMKLVQADNDGANLISMFANGLKSLGYLTYASRNPKLTKLKEVFTGLKGVYVDVVDGEEVYYTENTVPAEKKGTLIYRQVSSSDGKYITSVLGEFLQASLDNPKEQILGYLGANPSNAGFIVALAMKGENVSNIINNYTLNKIAGEYFRNAYASTSITSKDVSLTEVLLKELGKIDGNLAQGDEYIDTEIDEKIQSIEDEINNLKSGISTNSTIITNDSDIDETSSMSEYMQSRADEVREAENFERIEFLNEQLASLKTDKGFNKLSDKRAVVKHLYDVALAGEFITNLSMQLFSLNQAMKSKDYEFDERQVDQLQKFLGQDLVSYSYGLTTRNISIDDKYNSVNPLFRGLKFQIEKDMQDMFPPVFEIARAIPNIDAAVRLVNKVNDIKSTINVVYHPVFENIKRNILKDIGSGVFVSSSVFNGVKKAFTNFMIGDFLRGVFSEGRMKNLNLTLPIKQNFLDKKGAIYDFSTSRGIMTFKNDFPLYVRELKEAFEAVSDDKNQKISNTFLSKINVYNNNSHELVVGIQKSETNIDPTIAKRDFSLLNKQIQELAKVSDNPIFSQMANVDMKMYFELYNLIQYNMNHSNATIGSIMTSELEELFSSHIDDTLTNALNKIQSLDGPEETLKYSTEHVGELSDDVIRIARGLSNLKYAPIVESGNDLLMRFDVKKQDEIFELIKGLKADDTLIVGSTSVYSKPDNYVYSEGDNQMTVESYLNTYLPKYIMHYDKGIQDFGKGERLIFINPDTKNITFGYKLVNSLYSASSKPYSETGTLTSMETVVVKQISDENKADLLAGKEVRLPYPRTSLMKEAITGDNFASAMQRTTDKIFIEGVGFVSFDRKVGSQMVISYLKSNDIKLRNEVLGQKSPDTNTQKSKLVFTNRSISNKTVDYLIGKLKDKGIRVPITKVTNNTVPEKYKGLLSFVVDGVVFLNVDNMMLDTFVHEISHVFISALKKSGSSAYYNLVAEAKAALKDPNNSIAQDILSHYSELNENDMAEEYIASIIGIGSISEVNKLQEKLDIEPTVLQSIIDSIKSFWNAVKQFLSFFIGTNETLDLSKATIADLASHFGSSIINEDTIGLHNISNVDSLLKASKVKFGGLKSHIGDFKSSKDLGKFLLGERMFNYKALKNNVLNGKSKKRYVGYKEFDFTDMSEKEIDMFIDTQVKPHMDQLGSNIAKWAVGYLNNNTSGINNDILLNPKFIENMNSLKEHLGLKENEKVMTIDELNNTIIGGSRFVKPEFFDGSTLVVLHNDKSITISRITNEFLNDNTLDNGRKNLFAGVLPDETTAKEHDLRHGNNRGGFAHLATAMLAASIMQQSPGIKLRRIEVVSMSNKFDKGSFDITPQLVNMSKTLQYLKYGKTVSDLMDRMPKDVKALFENEKLHDHKIYNQKLEEVLLDYLTGNFTSRGIVLLNHSIKNFFKTGDEATLVKALERYVALNAKAESSDMLTGANGEIFRAASELLFQYKRTATDNYIDGKYENIQKLASTSNITDELFQFFRGRVKIAKDKIVDKILIWQSKEKKALDGLRQVFFARHPEYKVGLKYVADYRNKMFEKLYKFDTIDHVDEFGVSKKVKINTGIIHWEWNSEAQAAGLTEAEVNYGRVAVEQIETLLKKQIKSDFLKDGNAFYNTDGTVNNEALTAAVNSKYARIVPVKGMVPMFKKSVYASFQSAFTGNTKENIGNFVSKAWDNMKNPNKIYDDDYSLGVEGSITEVGDKLLYLYEDGKGMITKYGTEAKLASMGLYYDMESDSVKIDGNRGLAIQHDLATDMGSMLDIITLHTERKVEFEESVLPYYHATRAMMFAKRNRDGVDNAEFEKALGTFKALVIDNVVDSNIMTFDLFGTKVEAGAIVGGLIRLVTFSGVALSVPLALSSGMLNSFQKFSTAASSSLAQLGGEETGVFGLKEWSKAFSMINMGLTFARASEALTGEHGKAHENMRKIIALNKEFKIANIDDKELSHSPQHRKDNSVLFQSSKLHGMNRFTDYWARIGAMVAQMLKDGSWEAYSVDAEGNLHYDETKDARLYHNGVLTENGKLYKQFRKEDLVSEGKMKADDAKLTHGYTIKEALSIKAMTDKFIMGSYTDTEKNLANQNILGQSFMQFRQYVPDMIANKFGKKKYLDDIVRPVIVEKDGEKIVQYQRRISQGQVGVVWDLASDAIKLKSGIASWKSLAPEQKQQVYRLAMDLALFATLYMAYSFGTAYMAPDDDTRGKKLQKLRSLKLMRTFQYTMFDMLGGLSLSFYKGFMDHPIPVLNKISSLYELISGDFSEMEKLVPGSPNIKLYEDFDKVDDIYGNENE